MLDNFIVGTLALFGDPFSILIFVFGVIGGMLFGAIPGVSMLTPGMAPNSIPPITPKTKIKIENGSPNSASVPTTKLSIIILD